MYRLRAGGTALVLVVALLGMWITRAAALTQTSNVVARDSHGVVLPSDPLLKAGEHIELTITGFAPHAQLSVRLGPSESLGSYQADSHGVVRITVVIPNDPKGMYFITAVGEPPITAFLPTSVSAQATVDPQLFEAVIPTLGVFVFHTDPGGHSSSSPTSPSSSHSAGGTSESAGGGHVGNTGVPVAELLLVAAIGLIGGFLIAYPARRRPRPKRA